MFNKKVLIIYFIIFLFCLKIGYSHTNFRLTDNKQPVNIVNIVKSDINNLQNPYPILTAGIAAGEAATGFTLAEVLITLLIIGIVASIVIPALISDTQNAELKTAWKKEYAILDQATKLIRTDNGGTFVGIVTSTDHNAGCNDILNSFSKYLNVAKKCPSESLLGNCWHYPNTQINGDVAYDNAAYSRMMLSDGTLLLFGAPSQNCSTNAGTIRGKNDVCASIFVDVNGFKSPNMQGKDIFAVYVLKDRNSPYGSNDTIPPETNCTMNCINSNHACGLGCSALYLYQ